MKNKRNIILVIIGIIIAIIGIVFFVSVSNSKNSKKISSNINDTIKNYQSTDEMISFLYDRYQVEDGYKFSFVGSDMNQDIEDTYALYYRNKKTFFDDFPSIYKSYILLDLMNYDMNGYDDKRNCYLYPLSEFRDMYIKYYGDGSNFNIDTSLKYSPRFYLDNDNICITKDDGNRKYTKAIDTYFVNGIYKDGEIVIYERVAFIKIGDSSVDFYQDYSMKEKVYSLDKSESDLSFIHNSKIVSNVLMQYKDKFPIYEYHYKKGASTYYLESILK